MMKRKKDLISLLLLLVVWVTAMAVPHLSEKIIITPKGRIPSEAANIQNQYTQLIALDSVAPVTIPVIDSLCIVSDTTDSMHSFYHLLDALLNREDTVVNIVHLGDSHIQAGFYTGRTMRRLQQEFGNAGRGWISPLKLSKANEPDDYFIQSVIRDWTVGRCVQRSQKTLIGIGGMGIQTKSPSVNLDIKIGLINGAGYSFNEAILYRCEKSMPMLPAGELKETVDVLLAESPVIPGVMVDTFRIACLTDSLFLQSTRRKQGTDTVLPASAFINTYYGFQLKNGAPGILYHSIGVNGAMFVNYTNEEWLRQLMLLQPSLFIISLGTNESFGRRFTSAEFSGQARTFIRLVKKIFPETTLLITTPAECFKRVTVNKKRNYVRNENIERVADSLVAIAKEEGIACWDLFRVTGGKGSCSHWYDNNMMGRDRIHFTKEGYQDQGELLYRSLIKSFNAYLESKTTI